MLTWLVQLHDSFERWRWERRQLYLPKGRVTFETIHVWVKDKLGRRWLVQLQK